MPVPVAIFLFRAAVALDLAEPTIQIANFAARG